MQDKQKQTTQISSKYSALRTEFIYMVNSRGSRFSYIKNGDIVAVALHGKFQDDVTLSVA